MKNKKAIIEVQFNWIYVAVIGAILLLIFVNIAAGIKKGAQEKLEYEAINYFDEIFTSMQGNENTEHTVTLSGMEVIVEGNGDVCHKYFLGKSQRSTEFLPLFSPGTIKKKVLSYSLGWDVPFRSNYFLYLTSPEVAYVFDDDQLYEDMPKHITKKTVNAASGFTNQNYYKVRFVFFNNQDPGPVSSSVSKIKDKDVTAIKIVPDSNLYGHGEIVFYQKQGSTFVIKGTTYYMDKPTLFAAIYSENKDAYECNLNKAIIRADKISSILEERSNVISGSNLMDQCNSNSYTSASQLLGDIKEKTSTFEILEDFNDLVGLRASLQELNTQINRQSCPTIY